MVYTIEALDVLSIARIGISMCESLTRPIAIDFALIFR